jgi:hypothetical protein
LRGLWSGSSRRRPGLGWTAGTLRWDSVRRWDSKLVRYTQRVPASEWQSFKDHLDRQLRFIERSCGVYDEGYTDEAIQIAVRIRVILHPGGKKRKSLLQHLNSGRIPLLTTSEDVREFPGLIQHDGLTSFRVSSDGEKVSSFDGPGEDNALYRDYIKADKWWQQGVLFAEGTRYSRRDVVLGVAEQEGGAHVAAEPTAEYQKLMTPGLTWDLVDVNDGVETITPVGDLRFKYVRQMAYELLNSPELLKLAGYSPTCPAKREEQPADAENEVQPADGEGDGEAQDELAPLDEPEPQRPRPAGVKLTNEVLERIREEVIRYFRAYYAEVRAEIEKRDPEVKLDYLRGSRHIVFEMGNDGAIITHFPIEGDEDTFEFVLPKDRKMVREMADDKALKTPRGVTKRIHFDYSLGDDFRQNTYLGPLTHQEKDVHYRPIHYRTTWVQLDWASWVNLDKWRDAERAKEDARTDLDIRLEGVY